MRDTFSSACFNLFSSSIIISLFTDPRIVDIAIIFIDACFATIASGTADFEGGDGFPPTMGGERPDLGQRSGNGNVSKEEMMAAQKKKEQSMKKILNPEQYEKWLKLDKKKLITTWSLPGFG